METASKALLMSAFAVLLVAAESIRETASVQLASELNVGFELLSSCARQGVVNYEASELCQGRKPYQLYATTACKSFFWCSPDHAACTTACPSGTVFNHACNCCQDSTVASAAGFDASTCSSAALGGHAVPLPQQQQEAAPTLARRHLLEAHPGSTQAVGQSSNDGLISGQGQMHEHVRARARMMRRKRRQAAMRAAAAAEGSTSSSDSAQAVSIDAVIVGHDVLSDMLPGGQLFPSKRRMARRASRGGVWNSHGKRYSSGEFAGKNIVKEPAVRLLKPSTAVPTAVAVDSAEAVAIGAVPAATSAVAKQRLVPAANSTTTSSKAALRQLLADTPQAPTAGAAAAGPTDAAAHPDPSHQMPAGGRRAVQVKRVQRFAAQAAAAAAAAGDPAEVAATGDALETVVHGVVRRNYDLNPKLRPMDQKPAAKAIDQEDEQAAPFAAALATKQQEKHKMQQQVAQHSRAPGQQAMRRVPLKNLQ